MVSLDGTGSSDDDAYGMQEPGNEPRARYPLHDCCEFEDADTLKVSSWLVVAFQSSRLLERARGRRGSFPYLLPTNRTEPLISFFVGVSFIRESCALLLRLFFGWFAWFCGPRVMSSRRAVFTKRACLIFDIFFTRVWKTVLTGTRTVRRRIIFM